MNFPPDLEEWIGSRVAEGRYVDADEYLRDLVRRDQEGLLGVVAGYPETPEYVAWVRMQVEVARTSPVIDRDPRDVIEDLIAKRHAAAR